MVVTSEQSKRGLIGAGVFAFLALTLLGMGGAFAQTPVAPEVLNDNGFADTGDDSRPQIATDGAGNWVAVWDSYEDINGTMSFDFDILVSRSTDNGVTWTTPARLNSNGDTDTGADMRPIIATDRAGVWVVVWESDEELNGTADPDLDIFFSRSTDNGATWSPVALLNTNGNFDVGDDEIPYIATDRMGNWITIWDSNQPIGGSGFELDIIYSRSTDGGVTWGAPALLNTNGTTDSGDDFRAQIETDGDGNWIACWASNTDLDGVTGDFDIHFARSTDIGVTWSAPALIHSNGDTDAGDDLRPGLTSDGNGNWVAVWNSEENLGGTIGGDLDILSVRSSDDGATWSAPIALNANATTDSGADELVRVMSDGYRNWIAVWNGDENLGGVTDGDFEVFFSRSTDLGATWSPVALLNTNGEDDGGIDLVPQTATDGLGNWVAVWESNDNWLGKGFDYDILTSRFFIDPTAPIASSITPSTTGPTTATSVDFTVQFSEDVTGFNDAADLVITHTGTANSGVNITGGPSLYTASVTGITGTGSFTVAVSAASDVVDLAANPLEFSATSVAVNIDNTAPVVTLSTAAGDPVNGAITVNVSISEPVTTFGAGDITPSNASVSNFSGSGSTYSFTLTPNAGGLFTALVDAATVTDPAGNPNAASNTLSRTADLVVPTVSLSSSALDPVNGEIEIEVAISEVTVNFTAGDISVVNATIDDFAGSGDTYTFTLIPTSSGVFSATVNAGVFSDAAGNLNTASNTESRTADLIPPGIVLSSAAPNPTNAAISVSVALSENSVNFASGDISTVNSTVSNFSGSGDTYSFTLTPSGDGLFSATVNAGAFTDAVGNGNTVSNTLSRTFDQTPPTVALSSSSSSSVNAPVTVNVALSEPSTTFASGDVSTVNATVSNFSGSGDTYSFTLTPTVEGLFSATVNSATFTDAATNPNTASNTFSRTFDQTAPTVSMSSIFPNPTTSSTIPVTVTFNEPVIDFTAGDITPGNASVSNFSGSGDTYTFNLLAAGDGLVTANITGGVATDAAGNANTAAAQFSRTYNIIPLITLINDVTVEDATNYSVTPTLVEGTGPITWSLVAPASPPSNMAINPSTGQVTWTASYFFNPVDVTIRASGPGGFDDESWRITILPPPIWVDFAYTGVEVGTFAQPFNTLAEAVAAADPNNAIRIKGNTAQNSSNETSMVVAPVRLEAAGGPVRIGGPFPGRAAAGGSSAADESQSQTGFVKRKRK